MKLYKGSDYMNEEEILKECNELSENKHHELGDCWDEEYSANAIKGLLDLYTQEKEKNKKLEEVIDMMAEDLVRVPENDFMSETKLSVVHLINLHIEEKKEHIKEYYFNKVKGNQNEE